jgi:hypothetical protein
MSLPELNFLSLASSLLYCSSVRQPKLATIDATLNLTLAHGISQPETSFSLAELNYSFLEAWLLLEVYNTF